MDYSTVYLDSHTCFLYHLVVLLYNHKLSKNTLHFLCNNYTFISFPGYTSSTASSTSTSSYHNPPLVPYSDSETSGSQNQTLEEQPEARPAVAVPGRGSGGQSPVITPRSRRRHNQQPHEIRRSNRTCNPPRRLIMAFNNQRQQR